MIADQLNNQSQLQRAFNGCSEKIHRAVAFQWAVSSLILPKFLTSNDAYLKRYIKVEALMPLLSY
jgi:hypothetical protein